MSKHITAVTGAIAAGVAVAAAGLPSAGAAAPLAASPSVVSATATPAAGPGSMLWVSRYNGPANGADAASAVAIGPGGGRVFVTGASTGAGSGSDYATVAYNAVTGKRLWVSRYNGPGNGADAASAITVSPGGGRVFVTGGSEGVGTGGDYATVAYNAATGAQLWVVRYNGPGNSGDAARSVAVSPRGGTVFVTGSVYWSSFSADAPPGNYYGTLAYNAATGGQLWARLFPKNAAENYSMAFALAVSPRGGKVFIAGRPDTIAYNYAGKLLWTRQYPGSDPWSVAVSPNGTKVFVTGFSMGDYATVGYNAATGARIWARRYSSGWAYAVAVSPDDRAVFVTGTSGGGYATVAYSAATGARIWVSRYGGPGNRNPHSPALAVTPRGSRVFVACTSHGDYTTIAYKS